MRPASTFLIIQLSNSRVPCLFSERKQAALRKGLEKNGEFVDFIRD